MNPFDFLQYIPESERDSYIQSMSQGAQSGWWSPETVGSSTSQEKNPWMKNAGNFAMANVGAITQGATSLLDMSTNLFGKSGVAVDESGNRMGTDIYGRPTFTYQNYENAIDQIRDGADSEVGDSIKSGIKSGVSGGAAIGSLIPGVGTALGAAGGAVVGTITGLIGGKKRKNEMEDEIANRESKLNQSIRSFNQDNTNYFQSNMADSVSSYLQSQRMRRLSA